MSEEPEWDQPVVLECDMRSSELCLGRSKSVPYALRGALGWYICTDCGEIACPECVMDDDARSYVWEVCNDD